MLRVGFDPADIEADEVFWKMKKWERGNRRYPLIRHWRSLDPLDSAWDQRYWRQDLSALLRTLDAGALMGVFKMDLDNFKAVNEKLGHEGGDEGIRLYCATVRGVLGSAGEVYRRGGDEVVVLAPGISEGTGRELAEKTRFEIESVFRQWSTERHLQVPPTASIGLVLSDSSRPAEQIVTLVDSAQQRAKDEGKNRVVVYT